ncbi:uncharacterized protein B0I36DRAFT_329449 [Microdochium trichocladiopsis]|uniref:Uncharacterized protein n=1 Tax=Microdochium trichocladiopsis TaxID=1682393 RepID=A0A9P9BM46_9PEZI|nr:uncharacterized protein B0I36DRAFT_329449 [Microdochium trichocladiopsis]KAH7025918.1 hypothetical protein B0I36DRAFT_329449 [Microdochium trichocladiopsis]
MLAEAGVSGCAVAEAAPSPISAPERAVWPPSPGTDWLAQKGLWGASPQRCEPPALLVFLGGWPDCPAWERRRLPTLESFSMLFPRQGSISLATAILSGRQQQLPPERFGQHPILLMAQVSMYTAKLHTHCQRFSSQEKPLSLPGLFLVCDHVPLLLARPEACDRGVVEQLYSSFLLPALIERWGPTNERASIWRGRR